MNPGYFTEDIHNMDIEDLTQLVKFQVAELRKQNFSDAEIVEFDENETWRKVARTI